MNNNNLLEFTCIFIPVDCMHIPLLYDEKIENQEFSYFATSKLKWLLNEMNKPPSCCDINIETHWTSLERYENDTISPFTIASFDIECTSSHGDFPVAIKNYKKLAQDLCYLSKSV